MAMGKVRRLHTGKAGYAETMARVLHHKGTISVFGENDSIGAGWKILHSMGHRRICCAAGWSYFDRIWVDTARVFAFLIFARCFVRH
jgi:hypothetical protein